ncbi:hypothetical protein C8R48DRAFT_773559 [Suillus tomentosus]|nr:hypothetical protein C8R48DRAFT_773559 [Suillus tomentosus]
MLPRTPLETFSSHDKTLRASNIQNTATMFSPTANQFVSGEFMTVLLIAYINHYPKSATNEVLRRPIAHVGSTESPFNSYAHLNSYAYFNACTLAAMLASETSFSAQQRIFLGLEFIGMHIVSTAYGVYALHESLGADVIISHLPFNSSVTPLVPLLAWPTD